MSKKELSPEVKALLAKRFPAGGANGPSIDDVEKAKDDVAQSHANARKRAAEEAKFAKAEAHGKRGKKKQADEDDEKIKPVEPTTEATATEGAAAE